MVEYSLLLRSTVTSTSVRPLLDREVGDRQEHRVSLTLFNFRVASVGTRQYINQNEQFLAWNCGVLSSGIVQDGGRRRLRLADLGVRLWRRGDEPVMHKREVAHSRDHPASTKLVENTHSNLSRLAHVVTQQ